MCHGCGVLWKEANPPQFRFANLTPPANERPTCLVTDRDGPFVKSDRATRVTNGANAQKGVAKPFHDVSGAREMGGEVRDLVACRRC